MNVYYRAARAPNTATAACALFRSLYFHCHAHGTRAAASIFDGQQKIKEDDMRHDRDGVRDTLQARSVTAQPSGCQRHAQYLNGSISIGFITARIYVERHFSAYHFITRRFSRRRFSTISIASRSYLSAHADARLAYRLCQLERVYDIAAALTCRVPSSFIAADADNAIRDMM